MMTNKPAAPPPFTVPNNKTVLDCPAEPLPRMTYPKAVQYLLELAARGESLGYSTTFITLEAVPGWLDRQRPPRIGLGPPQPTRTHRVERLRVQVRLVRRVRRDEQRAAAAA